MQVKNFRSNSETILRDFPRILITLSVAKPDLNASLRNSISNSEWPPHHIFTNVVCFTTFYISVRRVRKRTWASRARACVKVVISCPNYRTFGKGPYSQSHWNSR